MGELIAGVLVTAAALVAILEPLFNQSNPVAMPVTDSSIDDEEADIEESDSPRIRALLALKEIEFDLATGKLSETDYAELKAKYSAEAVAAIKDEEGSEAAAADDQAEAPAVAGDEAEQTAAGVDPVELAVQRARAKLKKECPTCGPRPEAGAVFCSTCGRALNKPDASARCWLCGQSLPKGAKFCDGCGGEVAA